MLLSKTKSIILLSSILVLLSFAAADYNIETIGAPTSYQNVTGEAETIQFINVTDTSEGQPVTPFLLDERNLELRYEYEDLEEDEEAPNPVHYDNGLYYAEFETLAEDENIEYELVNVEDDDEFIEASAEEMITSADKSIDFKRMIDDPVKAEKDDQIIEVYLRDQEGNALTEDELPNDPRLTFSQITDFEDKGSFGFVDEDEEEPYFSHVFETPSETETLYVGQVKLFDAEDNVDTTRSFFLETKPPLEGRLTDLSAQEGCNNVDLDQQGSSCEGNASVHVEYNVTESEAEEVNVTVELANRTTGEWKQVQHHEMSTYEDSKWNTTFEFPFVNAQEYDVSEGARIQINASSDTRTDLIQRNIGYDAFILDIDYPEGTEVFQGEEFEILYHVRRPYTSNEIPPEELNNLTSEILDSNEQLLENYTIEEMEFIEDDNRYRNIVDIPIDAEPGTYGTMVEAIDDFYAVRADQREFDVKDIVQVFDAEDIEVEKDKKGVHEETLNLVNNIDEQTDLHIEIPDSINETLHIENQSSIELEPSEEREHPIEIELTEMTHIEEELTLYHNDSTYNQTIDFIVNTPECNFIDNDLCSKTGQMIIEEEDERTTNQREFEVQYVGEHDNTTIDVTTTGNISEYLHYDEENWTDYKLNHTHDQATIPINYSFERPGVFTGNITIEGNNSELQFSTMMNSTVPPQDLEMEIDPQEITSGQIIEGEDHEESFSITNTGDLHIDEIDLTSEEYTLSTGQDLPSLEAGEQIETTLTLHDIDSDQGQITVTSMSEEDEITETVSVAFEELTPDYGQQISDLYDEIESVRSDDTQGVAVGELSDAEASLGDADMLWQSGDYEEAIQEFESAQQSLQQAEQQVQEAAQDQEQEETDQQQPSEPEDGGSPLLPILSGVFVVFLVGFVAYSSIIPEEGDPLYDVLEQ